MWLVVVVLVVVVVVMCNNKNEDFRINKNDLSMIYTTKNCPKGFVPSLNTYACVLPGEYLPDDTYVYVLPGKYLPGDTYTYLFTDDGAFRKLLGDTPIPSGWHINTSGTGIKKNA
jgi:hypothetical protein